jgi:hypothetical protein
MRFIRVLPDFLLTPAIAAVVTFTTEFSSNAATATVFLPLLAQVCALYLGAFLCIVFPLLTKIYSVKVGRTACHDRVLVKRRNRHGVPPAFGAGAWRRTCYFCIFASFSFPLLTKTFSVKVGCTALHVRGIVQRGKRHPVPRSPGTGSGC